MKRDEYMTPEKAVENKIRQAITKNGGWVVKFFASPNTNKGVPDLLSVLDGHFCSFEIKRKTGGKPTPVQLEHAQRIANAGGYAFITNDPNLPTYLHKHFKRQKVTLNTTQPIHSSKNVKIDHFTLSDKPTVSQATHIWQQTKGVHNLQILPNK